MLDSRLKSQIDSPISNRLFIPSEDFVTPKNAAIWASGYLGKNVTSNNIIYLINYGKIANHAKNAKENLISKDELKAYYDEMLKSKNELFHPLSFSHYKEAETTKHIHRLHPYKGKFIPQLVEYFLDCHIDSLKTEIFFQQGDIVLDPFCGSGTTLSVANELGIHALGIEISSFNALLSNAKIKDYDLSLLKNEIDKLTHILESFNATRHITEFEIALNEALSAFNQAYFPSKEFKRKVALKQIDEKSYGVQKEREFLPIFEKFIVDFGIDMTTNSNGDFLQKWYLPHIRAEILLLRDEIAKAPSELKDILRVILSRVARSCRATTHSDLATLDKPMVQSYYCAKHGRICKPLFSIAKWWKSYSTDALKRLAEFNALKTPTHQLCINADSTNCDILSEVMKQDLRFGDLIAKQKIAGIFSSPPYVGLIDYHEQHAYAYDIFGFSRKDECEIGSLKNGQNKSAQEQYTQKIASVLRNVKPFLTQDYKVFLVANDRFNLYPKIAQLANMSIVKRYERPVLNRSEKDKNKYSESIFLLQEKI